MSRTLVLASVAGLAAAGALAARSRSAGSRALSPGSIFVLPDIEEAWNAWTRHRVDAPIAWHESDALTRDAYMMSDLLSDCADAVGWDSWDDNARSATGGFWRNEVNGEAKARNEVHGELREIASALGAFSFPLTVYRGNNILAGEARRQMATFLAKRQATGDHGHWTTDIRVARHFANGTHDASEIQGGVPHLYRGTIVSAPDVRWRSTISALFGYGMDDDPVHSEFEIYARKIQDIQEIA